MASAVAEAKPTKKTWGDFKSKRTMAIPKHTLFGSNMEMLNDDEKKTVEEIDVEEYQTRSDKEKQMKSSRYKVKLPPGARKILPDDALQHTREEYLRQLQQTRQAKQLMNTLDEKSKYFSVGMTNSAPAQETPRTLSQWMRPEDLDNADKINIMGVGGTTSYNHHKYGRRPPAHRYTNVGDPLRLGMEQPDGQVPCPPGQHSRSAYSQVEHKRAPDWRPSEYFMYPPESLDDPSIKLAVNLPPNIRHQFGTKICRNVLQDEEKVNSTMQNQKQLRDSSQKARRTESKEPVLHHQPIDPNYQLLGNALRQNIFPGNTFNHTHSLTRSVYTDEVYKKREPDPDEYRCHRDELSTWAEQNVLRERMKKAWDQYLTEILTAKAK